MRATMMDSPLTLAPFLARAERMFADVPIVSRRPDRSIERAHLGELVARARGLAAALQAAGVRPGDRIGTLQWNHLDHLAAYFGIPCSGAVMHTLNLRLSPDEIAYIVDHAGDRIVLVDDCLQPLWAKVRERTKVERTWVVRHDDKPVAAPDLALDGLCAAAPPCTLPALDERAPLGMCYTSGTTGRPKGVVYSHRSTVLHSMAVAMVDGLGLGNRDVVLPVVPMFHANAWGIPYAAVMVGARLVMPGPHLDALSVLDLLESEQVTCAAGVPTVWGAILEALDKEPTRWKLAKGLRMVIGGAAVPEAMVRGFDRHGLSILHAWGMTEMSPLGSVAHLRAADEHAEPDRRYALRTRQGYPPPMVEVRAMGEQGEAAWDDHSRGELEVRGPWIAAEYHAPDDPDVADKWTADGWFRTGDVVVIDPHGSIKVVDRAKDLIKSGGEWVSSLDLENAIALHPAVREVAVVAVAHPRWGERPLAVVVKKDGAEVSADELRSFLAGKVSKLWIPDGVTFIDAIPRTSTGKHDKKLLRDRFAGWKWD